jgi:hypothetical protein
MDQLPGGAVAHVQSDTAGKFELKNVPSGSDIPLVVTIGKWRRKVVIPSIQQCTDTPLPSGLTSLPKNKMEGDIPRIAVATGSFDALECLLRKVGVADSEFTADSGTGRVHLYAGYGGADSIGNSTATVSPASALWGSVDKMKQYDMMLFSCEGAQHPEEKPQAYMNNVKQYADLGGRLFMSHYHSIWIDGDTEMPTHAPPVWPEIATCDVQNNPTTTGVIDEINNPKGSAFSKWMMNVMGSAIAGTIAINESRQSCSAIDNTRAERWVYMKSNGSDFPQTFQFTTPNEVPKEQRCGKVVFSDMHVASGSTSSAGTPFPQGCAVTEMSPQEKALAFMLFDIVTCVGPIL